MAIRKKGLLQVLFLLIVVVGMVFIGTEVFQIKEIEIIGNDKTVYKDNEIIKKSGIVYEENIFKLDKSLAKKRLETDPYIQVISIERGFPDKIIIKMKERKPCAIIPYMNSFFVIDDEGVLLEIKKDLNTVKYPIIRDIQVKSFILGQKIVTGEEYELKTLCYILENLYEKNLQDKISEIKMQDFNDILMISSEGIFIRLGQPIDIDKKFRWLTCEDVDKFCRGMSKGVLDISVVTEPVFHPLEN